MSWGGHPLNVHPALLLGVALLAAPVPAPAQVRVVLRLGGDVFVRHEPLLAAVQITNLAGKNMEMRNAPGRPWLEFQISRSGEETILPRNNPGRGFTAVHFPAGQTLQHTVDLTPLYPIQDLGPHSVTAVVYSAEMNRFFSSNKALFEIRPGRVRWSQMVGVPGSDALRKYSMLSERIGEHEYLYVRVEEGDGRRIYATRRIGHLLSFGRPQVELDADNILHMLFLSGPRSYIHLVTGLDGQQLGRCVYVAGQTRPMLRRDPDGEVSVVGGEIRAPRAEPADGSGTPRVSDRPPGVPPAP